MKVNIAISAIKALLSGIYVLIIYSPINFTRVLVVKEEAVHTHYAVNHI